MILLIDNYDSFVFNLARYLRELGQETRVLRNDRVSVAEIAAMQPAAVALSPGPGTPESAGICVELVRRLRGEIPLLGVCLGHQAIAAAYGAEIIPATEPIHGRTSAIIHDRSELFAGLDNPFTATRYHSLIVDETTLPSEMAVTARTPDGVPMALRHAQFPVFGVQFHPESILTTGGHRLLRNFLRLAGLEANPAKTPLAERVPVCGTADVALPQPLHW